VRRNLRKRKVEQPLRRRANGHAALADPRREDFANVQLRARPSVSDNYSPVQLSGGDDARLTHGTGPHEMLYVMASR